MLTAYFDESRMDYGKPFPVLAGYVAPVENWVGLIAAWRAALQENGLQSFHAKDCWANKKEFKDSRRWGKDEKARLVNRLLDIIQNHVEISILSTLDNDAYLELTDEARRAVAGDRPPTPPRFNSQYELCGFSCSVLLGRWAATFNPSPIGLVFDEGSEHRHNFEIGHSLVRVGPWPWARYLGSVTFASDVRVVPLQAADLYAWTMARTIDEGMAQSRSPSVPWAYRAWHDVPRLENYMKRRVLTAMREEGVWAPDSALDPKAAAKFVRAVRTGKLFENL